ncbi:MAG: hypothetical protein JNK23_04090 [Opitutaceae bacterium]|nr:hypothetical protein [Opitutaceae bacterium]
MRTRKDIHANARTTRRVVERTSCVCPKTIRKWVARYRDAGTDNLKDRSSRPCSQSCAHRLCGASDSVAPAIAGPDRRRD